MKRKISNNNLTKVKWNGLNFSNFISLCTTNNITLHSIKRLEGGSVEFELTDKDLKILQRLDISKYNLEIVKWGGLKNILNTLIYRVGLIIGLAVSIIAMCVLNNRLFRIHVYGLTSISEQEVVDKVKDFGVGMLSSLDFDKDELENYLSSQFDFSLVSIITKGNSLIISVKEEISSLEDSYIPITADYNMVIKSINVYSGTAKVKAGDVVYIGDTLVEPYVEKGDSKVYVTPCAEITATAYFSASYNFQTSKEELIRTGEKKIVSSSVSLGKYNIISQSTNNPYEQYELEVVESNISQYFLPIIIKKTYAYEVKMSVVERNFESEKDSLITSVKKEAYNKVPSTLTVNNEDIVITDTLSGHIINVYLTCDISLRYEYHAQ